MGRISETSSRWGSLLSPFIKVDPDLDKKNMGAGAKPSRRTNVLYLALAALIGLTAFIVELSLADLGGYVCFAAIIAVVVILSRIKV